MSDLPLTIVTGASQNHFKSLKQFLSTVDTSRFTCYVYDLGLDKSAVTELTQTFTIQMRTFDYSKYPPYFNIHVNAGEYAWKPAIIFEVMSEVQNGLLLWCDAGNKIHDRYLRRLREFTTQQKIYSPSSDGTIKQWTHQKTLDWFSIPSDSPLLQLNNKNGAILAFNINESSVREFITSFIECAKQKECIAPDGSSRQNHRQDQAVFTILYYMFLNQYNICSCERYFDISIHQDID